MFDPLAARCNINHRQEAPKFGSRISGKVACFKGIQPTYEWSIAIKDTQHDRPILERQSGGSIRSISSLVWAPRRRCSWLDILLGSSCCIAWHLRFAVKAKGCFWFPIQRLLGGLFHHALGHRRTATFSRPPRSPSLGGNPFGLDLSFPTPLWDWTRRLQRPAFVYPGVGSRRTTEPRTRG